MAGIPVMHLENRLSPNLTSLESYTLRSTPLPFSLTTAPENRKEMYSTKNIDLIVESLFLPFPLRGPHLHVYPAITPQQQETQESRWGEGQRTRGFKQDAYVRLANNEELYRIVLRN